MAQVVPTPASRVVIFADGVRELPRGWEDSISELLVVAGECELTFTEWYFQAVQKPRADDAVQAVFNNALRGHFGR